MKLHDLLFSGSFEGKYFKKVVVSNIDDTDNTFEIDHEVYSIVLGQSEYNPTNSYFHEFMKDYESDDFTNDDMKMLKKAHKLANRDTHIFNITKDGTLSIELDY